MWKLRGRVGSLPGSQLYTKLRKSLLVLERNHKGSMRGKNHPEM